MVDRLSFEKRLVATAGDADALGATLLTRILDSCVESTLVQSAFDCLELWESFPSHVEPLYAAASLFFEAHRFNLALLAAEFALTIPVMPATSFEWPFESEATGWKMELLYARSLVKTNRAVDAMTHYASVLSSCPHDMRSGISNEVAIASRQLPLCEIFIE